MKGDDRMVVNKNIFPSALKDKIAQGVNIRKVNIEYYDGADIMADNTNIRFIEPYKVLFTSKNQNPKRYLVALIFANCDKQTIFVNEIGEHNKVSLTKLIKVVNDNIN